MGIASCELLNPSLVPNVLECMVCAEVLLDPLECPHCQVAACSKCIHEWLGRRATCPQCRMPTPSFQLAHRSIRTQLGSLMVRCPKRGCNWVGPLDARAGHDCSIWEKVSVLTAQLAERDARIEDLERVVAVQSAELETLRRRRPGTAPSRRRGSLPWPPSRHGTSCHLAASSGSSHPASWRSRSPRPRHRQAAASAASGDADPMRTHQNPVTPTVQDVLDAAQPVEQGNPAGDAIVDVFFRPDLRSLSYVPELSTLSSSSASPWGTPVSGVATPIPGINTPPLGGISTPPLGTSIPPMTPMLTPTGGSTPLGGSATPVGGLATPVPNIITPPTGVAAREANIRTPMEGVATPVPGEGVVTPQRQAGTPPWYGRAYSPISSAGSAGLVTPRSWAFGTWGDWSPPSNSGHVSPQLSISSHGAFSPFRNVPGLSSSPEC
mmetsp:Transcript_57/g.156  ORF Transcript_57/g.156 Transcript_57/m.156 type:complete len:437 (-) Transcript_57:79-1389(-)